ncbi:hypothetical protein PHLGIDRAFT_131242 [Phlebiopsis gigantea 11061_1 CR5-6]|uniref:VPS9 domain-containing protein n=1 Tax=Phlebiopsis gigantea (strain 11061_1 CR5-6) TaxID=745531 RepID=A0A0C3NAH9_PHLG1|nr:hypothetical protein PHLGIDRAFT_131242 [Phlebiopsis gigantea 11061_1 CR5-6]
MSNIVITPQAERDLLDDAEIPSHPHILAAVPVAESEPNPWQSQESPNSTQNAHRSDHEPLQPTKLGDTIEPTIAKGLASEADVESTPVETRPRPEILLEFDPLASSEERAAKEAWETSESHPPPPRPAPLSLPEPEDIPPPPPSKNADDLPARSTPLSSFPSLAALARTFALPLTSRTRPRSLDTAAAVPSPATLSSFASQQQLPPTIESAPQSGRSTPSTRSGTTTSGDPPPFDFQKFLDQMKLKAAEPVAKYLRSFLGNFAKRTFTVTDQVKLINDFLAFISEKMRESEPWRNTSDAEFDNAMEGVEKLVMNRLYDYTFTPQVARMIPPRPITTDDLERDRVLSQRIALFRWIETDHLDIPEGPGSEGFLMFAQQELLKINHYKAPRDKLICILNCCKVIFGLLRHMHTEEGADSFIPLLIYVVLKSNPDHLLSNVEFINRFRNPAKLQSEAGYYLSSLMGAVSFIESMDHTSLSNITQEEFERNVEEAIQSLPPTAPQTPAVATPTHSPIVPSPAMPPPSSHTGEESAQPLALPVPAQFSEDARRLLQKTGDTISKPLSAIGRLLVEAEESLANFAPFDVGRDEQASSRPTSRPQTPGSDSSFTAQQRAPYKPRIRRVPSSGAPHAPHDWDAGPYEESPSRPRAPPTNRPLAIGPSQQTRIASHVPRAHQLAVSEHGLQSPAQSPYGSRAPTPNLDIAGMQAEIDRVYESATSASRETLRQIFPAMDAEIMDLVLEANDGDLGKSIEALLEMSSGT